MDRAKKSQLNPKQWLSERANELNEEVGLYKVKEFKSLSFFKKVIRIIKFVLMIVGCSTTVLGVISSYMTVEQYLNDDSVALINYQRGIDNMEDGNIQEAEKNFVKVYSINPDLMNIKYYYAYVEYLLGNLDKSYEILRENRNRLNENELTFYGMYELRNNNVEKSKKYINKIQEPENLGNPAFIQYVLTTVKLGFLEDYNTGLNVVYANAILFDAKINENAKLPTKKKVFYDGDGIKIDEKGLNGIIDRINKNVSSDIAMLNNGKLRMYMQFISYSFQYGKKEMPIYIFEDAAELFDYITNKEVSMDFLSTLCIYTLTLDIEPNFPKEIKVAFRKILKKYDDLLELEKKGEIELETEDKELFEDCKFILDELNTNHFSREHYDLKIKFGTDCDAYREEDDLKVWNRIMQDKYK